MAIHARSRHLNDARRDRGFIIKGICRDAPDASEFHRRPLKLLRPDPNEDVSRQTATKINSEFKIVFIRTLIPREIDYYRSLNGTSLNGRHRSLDRSSYHVGHAFSKENAAVFGGGFRRNAARSLNYARFIEIEMKWNELK